MKLILELDAFSKFYPSEVLFIKFNLRKLSSVYGMNIGTHLTEE